MEKIKSAILLLEEANKTLNQNQFYDWVQFNIKLLKDLEKEQIVVANRIGWMQGLGLMNLFSQPIDSEDYYNMTYVSDTNVGNIN
jgi:hypothetical protein